MSEAKENSCASEFVPPHEHVVINSIPLHVLLSTSIDACRRGCEVIRSVYGRSSTKDRRSETGAIVIAHTYKETSHNTFDPVTNTVEIDPRSALTEADEVSHIVVLDSLQCCWTDEMATATHATTDSSSRDSGHSPTHHPRLRVVSEEASHLNKDHQWDNQSNNILDNQSNNQSENSFRIFDTYNVPRPDVVPIITNFFSKQPNESTTIQNIQHPNLTNQSTSTRTTTHYHNQELIVFIDPLDGTREYIENRIHNVQCLIGITWNGTPIAGAVGLPFGDGRKKEGILLDTDNKPLDDANNIIEVAYGWVMPKNNSSLETTEIGTTKDTLNTTNREWELLLSGSKYFHAINQMASNDDMLYWKNGLMSSLDGNCDEHEDDDDKLIILTGDSRKPILQMAIHILESEVLMESVSEPKNEHAKVQNIQVQKKCIPPFVKIITGGCGNKILYVGRRHQMLMAKRRRQQKVHGEALNRNLQTTSYNTITCNKCGPETLSLQAPIVGTISIAPPGSSSWDTAAPTAILLSIDSNALVTDLLGRPLIYNGVQLTNQHGVVVSSGDIAVEVHRELCCKLASNKSFYQFFE